MLRECAKLLMPGLVEFIAKVAPLVHDGSVTEPQALAIAEVWKAFSGLFFSIPDDKRKALLRG